MKYHYTNYHFNMKKKNNKYFLLHIKILQKKKKHSYEIYRGHHHKDHRFRQITKDEKKKFKKQKNKFRIIDPVSCTCITLTQPM